MATAKIWKVQPSANYRKALKMGRAGVTPELDVWTETPLKIGRGGAKVFMNHPYYKGAWGMIYEQVGKGAGITARSNMIRLKGVKYVDKGQRDAGGVPVDTTKGGFLGTDSSVLGRDASKIRLGATRKTPAGRLPIWEGEPVTRNGEPDRGQTDMERAVMPSGKILGMPKGVAIGVGVALLALGGLALWKFGKGGKKGSKKAK